MKEHWHRVLPYAAIALDLLALWANATDNDFVTLDNLKFHLIHLTEHLIDARWYDWIFDCLQSFPEKYSDLNTEEFAQQLTENLILHCWYIGMVTTSVLWLFKTKLTVGKACFGYSLKRQGGSRMPVFSGKCAIVFMKCYNQILYS